LAKADPFLRWLRDAEEESDADDSDVEVVYDDNRNKSTLLQLLKKIQMSSTPMPAMKMTILTLMIYKMLK
ncbi:Translation initiation factor eIF-2B subunit epsilon, partial [Trichinella pseudospiralis]